MYNYIKELHGTINCLSDIGFITEKIEDAVIKGNTIWLAGNGGAAAIANHMQNDLIKMCGVKAISLCSNVETLLAYGNDCSFEDIFSKQLEVLAKEGDVVILFSTSGESKNLNIASDKYYTVGIFGNPQKTNRIKCDCIIDINSTDTQIIEDMHSIIMHLICRGLCK